MKGSYILIIENKINQNISIGKLGNIFFKKGFYIYVGSAMNSLEGRITRHKRSEKKNHWHIDYLLKKTNTVDIYYKQSENKEECKIAKEFSKEFEIIPSFGCSDCRCNSHLFFGKLKDANKIISNLKLKMFKKN